ncbi:glutamyl-tRNA(Gln) amidotransferase subunit E [Caloramator mitchellensis]|uniref:Glutamyl-tRNA(Gln) amidotransferase subunit E n=1 Tax=Caloramator mitchellensis TaxID=908809 RepID=A0A0R3JZF8_CALMK|nr:GatB/YqeY domain-containing protein [Caloramator mitchellensis]KRQ86654.1 glutamyl-tRNA(Gln) amidotransferase subunit E [Caloramator mitchellensis]
MSLKERIQEDWKNAMKAKDSFRASVLNMAKAAILYDEKTNGQALDDEQIIAVISREVKKRKESIADFEKGNRQDLVDQTNKEIEILLEYLPQQLTEEEIAEIIKGAVDEVGANSIKDMGKVMAIVAPKVKGRADGKMVSEMVKKFLQ